MSNNLFGYDGKRVVVVGGATGMGAATAKLAAESAPKSSSSMSPRSPTTSQSLTVDLRDQPSVDAAVDQIDGPVHAISRSAGVADGTPGIMLINFTAQRHLIDRMISAFAARQGRAVAFISSTAGMGWRNNIDRVRDFLSNTDWESAAAWTAANPDTDSYSFSKEAINLYVALQAFPMLKQGFRIRILPGPTDTPLAAGQCRHVAHVRPTTGPTPGWRRSSPSRWGARWCSCAATRRAGSTVRPSSSTRATRTPPSSTATTPPS
ncbi:MAG: hypothetical protein R2695_16085 [Acidimicrobiales bacterium]